MAGCGRLPWQAQPPATVHQVGILVSYAADDPSGLEMIEALREGLRAHGYVDGQNLIIEPRFAAAQAERLPDLAAELIRVPVDVLVTDKHAATIAAKQATATIPIVIADHADPVGTGLVASLARPGGNVTGHTSLAQGLAANRLASRLATLTPVACTSPT